MKQEDLVKSSYAIGYDLMRLVRDVEEVMGGNYTVKRLHSDGELERYPWGIQVSVYPSVGIDRENDIVMGPLGDGVRVKVRVDMLVFRDEAQKLLWEDSGRYMVVN